MPVGKPLQLRLFLEGLEVPVIAAQVSINVNAPAAASIQVIPLDEATNLKPRTMVHLFFLDSFDVRVSAAQAQAESRKEEDRLNIPFLDNYKLLFSGEVIGFQFVKTPASRAVVLQCLDFSSYWDTAHATAIEYGPNGNAFTHQGSLRASNTGLFDDIVNTTSDQLVNWLRQKPLTEGLKSVSGLAGGVIRVLEMMGGVPRHHRGVNDFFTIAELRCKVLAQITAEENDTTAADLLKVSVFDEWLRNGLQNIGQQVSFRDMLKLLFSYVHYDVVPNPAAKFEPILPGTTTQTTVTNRLADHPQSKKAVSDISSIKNSLESFIGSSDTTVLAVIPRNYKEQLRSVDSALSTLQSAKKNLKSDISKARGELSKAINALEAVKDPQNSTFIPNVVKFLDNFLTTINSSQPVTSKGQNTTSTTTQRLRSQIIRPDCFFAPPPRCNVIFPEQYTQLSYDRMYLAEVTRSLVLSYNTLVGKDALLADRILAPSVGIDTELLAVKSGKEGYRALMKHELHTGIIPRSEWLPNTSSFSSAKTDTDKNSKASDRVGWGRKIALFHFFKYRFGPRQASVGGRFNPYLVAGFPALIVVRPFIIPPDLTPAEYTDADIVDLIMSNSQTGSNAAKAPSQLIGMIGALSHSIDQNGGSTSISMNHVRQHLGVDDEFIGVFLKSKGIAKKRVRIVLDADVVGKSSKQSLKEILLKVTPQVSPTPKSKASKKSLVQRTVQGSKTSVDTASKSKVTSATSSTFSVAQESAATDASDVAPDLTVWGKIDKIDRRALIPNPPGRLTVNGKGVFGTIIGVEVVDATTIPLSSTVTFSTVEAVSTPAEVPITSSDPAQQFSAGAKTAKIKRTKTTQGQVFQKVILYEEIDVPVSTSLPIEEIIKPKFFSNSYSNSNIGKKIYMPFFGVPSIIDEAAFDGLGATVSSNPPNPEGADKDAAEDKDAVIKALASDEEARAKISIERSVNFIGYVYGLVKARGLDVDEFIRQYANRPIATLPQMLGDPDLEISLDGQGVASAIPRANGTTPRFGFHTLAVHPTVVDSTTKLAGLLTDPDLHVQRINNTGEAGPIPPEYDIRKEKKDRVRDYFTALQKGPGFGG